MKERIFIVIVDVVMIGLIIAGWFTETEVKALLMLIMLLITFVAYHITSVLLIKRLNYEQMQRDVEEIFREIDERMPKGNEDLQ